VSLDQATTAFASATTARRAKEAAVASAHHHQEKIEQLRYISEMTYRQVVLLERLVTLLEARQ
jgi:hypothetical protein